MLGALIPAKAGIQLGKPVIAKWFAGSPPARGRAENC
jgi:hypothetical protein